MSVPAELAREWERRLSDEGMPAEPPSRIRIAVLGSSRHRPPIEKRLQRFHDRMADAMAWDQVVRGYLERCRWRCWPRSHRRIWVLYVNQVPVRQVGLIVKLAKSHVHRIINRHLQLALSGP